MDKLDQYKGMSSNEINFLRERVQKFLRDHSQFIERISSLSKFYSEYDAFIEYLKGNQFIFEILDIDKKIFNDLVKSKMIRVLIKDNLETTRELSYKRIKRLEKFNDALCQSRNLLEEKIHLERNFEIQ